MRVLTVLVDVPTPARTGLHIRQLAMLRLVRALGCQSHVLVFTTADRPEVPAELGQLCDSVLEAGPRVEYSRLPLLRRALLRGRGIGPALLRRPASMYPFSIPYDLAGGSRLIVEALAAVQADAVLLPTFLVHYAPRVRSAGAMVVGDATDVVSQLTWRLLRFGRRKPWRMPGLVLNHLATAAQEDLFLGACSEIWATTESEAASLRSRAPKTNVLVFGNAIDEQVVRPSAIPEDGPIGLIGNYSLAPNLAAACFLAERVFPIVKRTHPKVRLALAGRGMPNDVRGRFARIAGVELLGEVKDSVAFTRSCRVMALTVRLRGGLPLKLIEALACNRPVVATRELIDGLPLRAGTDVLVGDSPEEIAAALCRVLDDKELALSIAAKGHERFEAEFSLGTALRRMKDQSMLAGATVRT